MAQPFLTRPFSVALNFVRFLAALVVAIQHAAIVSNLKLDGYAFFVPGVRHNAVIVFFVLSGMMIYCSARNHASLPDFAVARASRIIPVAYASLVLSTMIYFANGGNDTSLYQQAPHFSEPGIKSIVLPALFLSQSGAGVGPLWNTPYWSLCYEVWYYVIFGLAFYLRGSTRKLALVAAGLMAGPVILLLFPVWAAGLLVAKANWSALSPRACWAVGLPSVIAALVLTVQSEELMLWAGHLMPTIAVQLKFSEHFVSDYLLTAPIIALILVIKSLAERYPRWLLLLDRPAALLSGMSFTLYLMHWPILLQLQIWHVRSQTLSGLAPIMLVVVLLCGALSYPLEHQRASVERMFRRWFGLAQRRPANSPANSGGAEPRSA